MNSLNSVLIEGNLIANPSIEADGTTSFTIKTLRFVLNSESECFEFYVKASGKLGAACASALVSGRGVRIVGRLARDEEGVHIVAEHVEFKPIN
jgi:single-stranded DNA-binding protein